MGAAAKKEFVHFYEMSIAKNQSQLNILEEATAEKPYDDKVIGGMYNCRKFSDWVKKWAKTSKLYSLVRRRGLEKKTD